MSGYYLLLEENKIGHVLHISLNLIQTEIENIFHTIYVAAK